MHKPQPDRQKEETGNRNTIDSKSVGIAIQATGLVVLGFSLMFLIAVKADSVSIGITFGSIIFALGTKIRGD